MKSKPGLNNHNSRKQMTASVIHICTGIIDGTRAGTDKENSQLEFQMMNMFQTLVQFHIQAKRKQIAMDYMNAAAELSDYRDDQLSGSALDHSSLPELYTFMEKLQQKPFQNSYCMERVLENLDYLSTCYTPQADLHEQPQAQVEALIEEHTVTQAKDQIEPLTEAHMETQIRSIHEEPEDNQQTADKESPGPQAPQVNPVWEPLESQEEEVLKNTQAKVFNNLRIGVKEKSRNTASPSNRGKHSPAMQPPEIFGEISISIGQTRYVRYLKSF
ncbi:hypothetical protein [Bacillus sp. FJAT-27264]|uniref:hypothetical protein n=1 Tax=Paenibacillus sp. (strain DSM 101736 / FJAT-27264) TaxID=1850362 RepID=UPI00111240D7|nr:hypothetical protein [Bacillus sp. FJAT-27264]